MLLAAHYDTVAGAPGAGDDGVGVGAVLEAARALTALGPSRNDLVVLLTDGEENGLLGAEAFMRERRSRPRGPTVALNHEARGVTGSPVTFRTSSPNSTLLEVLANAPGAAADSAAEAVFEALPNDTDFTRFAAGGLHGYDTAITGGGAYYHSPLDDPQHLNPSSLQQMGTTTLAVAHELAGRDLADVPAGGEDVVMSVPWGLVRYPGAAELPLALATLVLAGAVVALQRRRRALTVPRATASIVVAIGLLVAAVLGGSAVWWIALLLDPGQASAVVGEPYRPLPYQVAMLLAGVGLPLLLVTFARRLGAAAITSGALLAVALGGCLLAVVLPGASTALAPPALFAALGALVAALLPGRRTTVRPILVTLALVPAVILLGPAVWTGFELGLGSGGAGSVLFLAVLLLLVGPLLAAVRPSRTASIARWVRRARPGRVRHGRGAVREPRGRDRPPSGDAGVRPRSGRACGVLGVAPAAALGLEPKPSEPRARSARRRARLDRRRSDRVRARARRGAARPRGRRGRRPHRRRRAAR